MQAKVKELKALAAPTEQKIDEAPVADAKDKEIANLKDEIVRMKAVH